jgi:hypothetical protein
MFIKTLTDAEYSMIVVEMDSVYYVAYHKFVIAIG